MTGSFEKLGLIPTLAAGLKKAGIETPTAIQAEAVPPAVAGRDVVGQSATGTGKTLAYLLPLMQKIDTAKRETQAIILAPTHELAMQIQRQTELMAQQAGLAVTSTPVIGNVNITRQIEKLKDKPHIIVGSSGRILELIQKRKIAAATVKTIVLDEVDRLLNDQNIDSVRAVIKTTQRDRQLLLFSATVPPAAVDKVKDLLQDPVIVRIEKQTSIPADISHIYLVAEHRDKIEMLRKLVRHLNVARGLVFINQSDNIEIMTAKLNYHGLKAAGLHGNSAKESRKKAMDDFKSGRAQLLVASDLAARGLDIPGVTHVFNLDLPDDAQAYLHRVGRTGRAGQSGAAVSIVTRQETLRLQKYAKALNINILAKNLARGTVVDV
ncbi:MAG TPA: DEAD/DEAH box helicase [Methylomusa anaerophila]|uniref:DEAD-box ATP-dependent RNA helicase CshA n=1 Tax=Methylomusa anaerophila TaxID=1930071 RepID=A0A348AGS7_9FIRM|nr:DEAD/DEAH box helicase [Methylomusa anaerophila]BBB90275.1 DEAD-box ATP-dependent RNA helicase CshA [Methylomusa anaerophila]HML89380.1 DEAD/DEAH box helicase [Methylomusa anaerophila]